MAIILCLIIPLIAFFLLPLRWQHPWRLRLPLCLLRRADVDRTLLTEPRRMIAAHLPFEPTLQPRLQSGALLWASAATVTHRLADEQDQSAILAAVKPLGFTPEKFLARCPVIRDVHHEGIPGFIVRDGSGQRAYFLGEPSAVLTACTLIHDKQERSVTEQDRLRLPSGEGLYGLAMAPVQEGQPGPMTYLGSLQIAAAQADLARVQEQMPEGWVLRVLQSEMDAPAAGGLHISPNPQGDNRLSAAADTWLPLLHEGMEHFRRDVLALLRLLAATLTVGFSAMVWQLPAWAAPLAAVLLLPRSLAAPCTAKPTLRDIAALLWLILWPVAVGSFLHAVLPGSPALLLALFAGAACLGTAKASWKIVPPAGAVLILAAWLILQPGIIPSAFCLLAGVLHGLITKLILPMECS